MSNELAQTVGTKKVAWLLAILAAFAVFATVVSQHRDAKANVTGFTITLTGGFGATAQVGDVATYTLTLLVTATPAPTVGSANLNVVLDDNIGNITNIDTSGFAGFQNNYCSVSNFGGTNNRIDCTYPPFLPAGATGSITFQATALAAGSVNPQATQCSLVDNGAVDFVNCTAVPGLVDIGGIGASDFDTAKRAVDITQVTALSQIYQTERFAYQIWIDNDNPTDGMQNFSVSDQLPAGVTATQSGVLVQGGLANNGTCSANTGTGLVTCSGLDNGPGNATGLQFETDSDAILITVFVQMNGNTGTYPTAATTISTVVQGNTATITCNADGTYVSGVQFQCGAASPTVTITDTASVNVTPMRVVLTSDSVAAGNTCTIPTVNWNLPAGRVMGNVSALVLNTTADYAITGGTFTGAAVSTVGSERVLTFTPTTADVTYTIVLTWNAFNNAGGGAVATATATCDVGAIAAVNDDTEDLVHINPATGAVNQNTDVDNNVVGFTHTVCALNSDVDALWPTPLAGGSQNFQITTISGTANINGAVVTPGVDCDNDGFDDDSTISWYSTQPGEQNVVVVDDGGSVVLDSLGDVGPFDKPLVKEWNTLLPTTITSSALTAAAANVAIGVSPNLDGTTVTKTGIFDPISGEIIASGSWFENVLATHTNLTGTQVYFGIGAKVTFSVAGCGTLSLTLGTTPNFFFNAGLGVPAASYTNVTSVTVISNGVPIPFTVNANTGSNPCTSFVGSTTTVTVQAAYITSLGSNTPVIPAETIIIRYVAQAQVKQVLLAWAGQRVVLEHDWRIPPGDTAAGNPVGSCPLDGEDVTFVKSATSPGNFVEALDVSFQGPDGVIALVDGVDQLGDLGVFGEPDNSCISRAMYESEDPGEVDIESFIDDTFGGASSKISFVIYYMKFNSVTVSLVTQVSKPLHNSSAAPDYSPGNPWDATKDDADNAADWNVSKDLLVRGRVTGWFVNANPSGRAQDATDPLNVLPANRWVMPQDWPLIAGGPADPADGTDAIGTAESFRPTYDIMFAPNNTRGLSLTTPTGSSAVTLATVIAPTLGQAANSALAVHVSPLGDLALLAPCTPLVVGTTAVTFGSLTASTSTLTLGTTAQCAGTGLLAATPAVGTAVFVLTGVPFEGPFSLIDIIGLSAQGLGGAAASNILASTSAIRDTALDDGDVDLWDAPMPPADVSVAIRGTGFIKQVIKSDVYYLGTANSTAQVYPNPFYVSNIPDSPFISANAAGGGYIWDSWGNDGPQAAAGIWSSAPPGTHGNGPYTFWVPVVIGTNEIGIGDALTASNLAELAQIRTAYGDPTIARDLVVFSDNHGEFMVTANGDFKTDLTACATNVLAGGKHCKPGDKVGTGSISATVDYPDFRKHFPVKSNTATVTWTWGGYKDVTVENGETDQFKYIVFHAMDRDGFCSNSPLGGLVILLHPVLSSLDALNTINGTGTANAGDPVETVDFLIDSGEGIILNNNAALATNDGKQFATGITTFSILDSDPALGGPKEFPLSSLATAGATDECQAWIRVSNSLLGVVNVLAIAHDDEGNIGFDKVIDLTNTTSYTLNFRWSLITWAGADAIPVMDALKGTGTSGKNPGGNDISASVTAIYGWNQAAQQWLGFFPTGVNVPGANDLTALNTGQAYWIAITGPSSVTWTIASNVS